MVLLRSILSQYISLQSREEVVWAHHLGAYTALEYTTTTGVHELRHDTADVEHGDAIWAEIRKDRLAKGEQNHTCNLLGSSVPAYFEAYSP